MLVTSFIALGHAFGGEFYTPGGIDPIPNGSIYVKQKDSDFCRLLTIMCRSRSVKLKAIVLVLAF